jgi:membrane-associated phospholipid phosphatase
MQQIQKSIQQFLRHLPRHPWLRLLSLLFGVLLPFFVFGSLVEEVWENDGGFSWDVPILLAVHRMEQPQLDILAIYLTKLGVFWGVFPLALAIAVLLFAKRYWYKLTYWLTVLSGSIIINRTVKQSLHRVRPHLWESPAPEFDSGFPSGHAMSSMTMVAALILFTWETRWRWPVVILGSVFVVLIGWTRLYLGVHYPSDILAGWTVSVAWAVGVNLLIRPQRKRFWRKFKRPRT